jgi:hypothetical protein
MDFEFRKPASLTTQVWSKLPFALFLVSALILVATLAT